MKMIVSLLSAAVFAFAGSAFAAQEQAADPVAQCKQEAKNANVTEADMSQFIDNCINDKVGYERSKPGQAAGGGE